MAQSGDRAKRIAYPVAVLACDDFRQWYFAVRVRRYYFINEIMDGKNMSDQFCFCTLAVGHRYRRHARMLADDIQQYAPHKLLIVLTDQPTDFQDCLHVIAIKHTLQSVKGYHDKRCVIEQSLERFDACLFLDSDVRILGPVPTSIDWLPGITARTGCSILKHNSGDRPRKELAVIEQAAHKLAINLDQTQWFHEFMFAVKKQAGAETDFLTLWQTISYFFELQGVYDGEGNVMGLAAAKAGFPIQFDTEDRFPFFKDNIERVRIKHGQSDLKEKQAYFDIHREIEHSRHAIWQKAINKLTRKVVLTYRLLKLRSVYKWHLNQSGALHQN
jgi:hypothetical protein